MSNIGSQVKFQFSFLRFINQLTPKLVNILQTNSTIKIAKKLSSLLENFSLLSRLKLTILLRITLFIKLYAETAT